MALTILDLVIIGLAAFIPPLVYMVWVRDTEACRREPYSAVLFTFLYGATIAVGIAYILESVIISILYAPGTFLTRGFGNVPPSDPTLELFLLACIIAPIVEESLKASGMTLVYWRLAEYEDGLIYGAAIGLGFAASENLLYLGAAWTQGVDVFAITAVARALTSTLLHASAAGLSGYGIARSRLMQRHGVDKSWLPYLLGAMALHALFNGIAIIGDIFGASSSDAALISLALTFVVAWAAFAWLRRTIKTLDTQFPCVK
jgi:RsiW-degrading membrane proteinase PrsW (M82 family)